MSTPGPAGWQSWGDELHLIRGRDSREWRAGAEAPAPSQPLPGQHDSADAPTHPPGVGAGAVEGGALGVSREPNELAAPGLDVRHVSAALLQAAARGRVFAAAQQNRKGR